MPGESAAVDALYEQAYSWADAHGWANGDESRMDHAERFAAWVIQDSWMPGALILSGSLSADYARFKDLPA